MTTMAGAGKQLDEQEAELRHILSGPCFNCEGRWFASNASRDEVDDHIRRESLRKEHNRRLRERREIRRRIDSLDARIARMKPWLQSRLYGRTAVTTEINGELHPVDYAQTYGTPLGRYDEPILGKWATHDLEGLLDAVGRMWDGLRNAFGSADCPKEPEVEVRVGYIPPDVERKSRMKLERRKVSRRATVAACPTPTDLRVRWALRRADPQGTLRLGMLLLDLECYVDNSLVTRDVEFENIDGTIESRKKIVRRLGGIRQWLKDNCWELSDKYKTLMRYKSEAKRLCQLLDVPDPLPLSELIKPNVDIDALCAQEVHVQPREHEHHNLAESRFDWEQRPWVEDANGRRYHLNYRYSDAISRPLSADWAGQVSKSVRAVFNQITSPTFSGHDSSFSEHMPRARNSPYLQYSNGNWNMSIVFNRLDILLHEHEKWWAQQSTINSQSHTVARL